MIHTDISRDLWFLLPLPPASAGWSCLSPLVVAWLVQRLHCSSAPHEPWKLQWSTHCHPHHWETKANYSVKFLSEGWLDLIASHRCSRGSQACAEWWGGRADSGWAANCFGAENFVRTKAWSLQSRRDQSWGPSTTLPFCPTAGQSNRVSLGGARGSLGPMCQQSSFAELLCIDFSHLIRFSLFLTGISALHVFSVLLQRRPRTKPVIVQAHKYICILHGDCSRRQVFPGLV